ncbi:hypothetical protein HY837_01615 [archaeon]|nr:hypothetical protein [archaeon]
MIKTLVSGLIASTALTSTLYAQEQKTYSITELDAEYKQLVYEKLRDNLLTKDDVETFNLFLEQNLSKIAEQGFKQKDNPASEKNNLSSLDSIMEEYPGITDKTTNITYDSELKLKPTQSASLKKIIEQSENPRIKELIESELTIKDFVFINNQLKKQQIKETPGVNEEIKKSILSAHLELYNDYLKSVKNVENSYFNDKKYFSCGFFGGLLLSSNPDDFRKKQELVWQKLKEYTLLNDIKVPPTEQEFPNYPDPNLWYFLTFILSTVAPVPVRFLGKWYRGTGEFKDSDVNYHLIDGGVMSLCGLEIIHPSIFYVRLAAPLVHEVLKGWKVVPE